MHCRQPAIKAGQLYNILETLNDISINLHKLQLIFSGSVHNFQLFPCDLVMLLLTMACPLSYKNLSVFLLSVQAFR